jgi:hypothetical protein
MNTPYIIIEEDENYFPSDVELSLDNSAEMEYTTPYTEYGDGVPDYGNDLSTGIWDDR